MKKMILTRYLKQGMSILLIFCTIGNIIAQQENLNVLERWIEWTDGKNMLIHHLNDQAFSFLDQRDNELTGLKTEQDWLNRQKKAVSYTHLRAHETRHDIVCRLLLE